MKLPRELLTWRPVAPFQLDEDKLALNIWKARRDEDDMGAFAQLASWPEGTSLHQKGSNERIETGRTIAQQIGAAVERATSPFQCALKTRAGCECFPHAPDVTGSGPTCLWVGRGI